MWYCASSAFYRVVSELRYRFLCLQAGVLRGLGPISCLYTRSRKPGGGYASACIFMHHHNMGTSRTRRGCKQKPSSRLWRAVYAGSCIRTSENTPSETVWKIGSGPEWGPRRPPGGHEGESIGRLLAAKIYALEASGYFPNSFGRVILRSWGRKPASSRSGRPRTPPQAREKPAALGRGSQR